MDNEVKVVAGALLAVGIAIGAIGVIATRSDAVEAAVRRISFDVDDTKFKTVGGNFLPGLADGGVGYRIIAHFNPRSTDGGQVMLPCANVRECEGPFAQSTLDACEAAQRADCLP